MAGENINYPPQNMNNPPFGNQNLNPQASRYKGDSKFNPEETILLEKAVAAKIFDAAPQQYNAMKIPFLLSNPEDVNLDEFEYLEKLFGRSKVMAAGTAAAQPGQVGASQTQTFNLQSGNGQFVSKDTIIMYPNGKDVGTITTLNGDQVTITSVTGKGLPAVAANDSFSIQGPIEGDGMDAISNYSRIQTITRYNYVQLFIRAERWTRLEIQKFLNAGRTNYYSIAREEKIKQLRIDMFVAMINGIRGEYTLSIGKPAKGMGGIFQTMLESGSFNTQVTPAGAIGAFKELAFESNFKSENSTRFILGTQKKLEQLSSLWKDPAVRYAPNDRVASLQLDRYKFGEMGFVPVPVELFREESAFPEIWKDRLLVLDYDTIKPVKIKGIPMIEMGNTGALTRKNNGGLNDYEDFWVRGNLSLKMNNPFSSFWMDIVS